VPPREREREKKENGWNWRSLLSEISQPHKDNSCFLSFVEVRNNGNKNQAHESERGTTREMEGKEKGGERRE
jgi:hypothetical protein